MNKYQKKEVRCTKGIMRNSIEGSDFKRFRFARYYVRCILYNRQQEFLDWYLK